MSTITNGQIRRSLASQLDRLEGILHTLDANLSDVIATTVEKAVGGAVEMAVVEVLTNPTLSKRLHPEMPKKPSVLKSVAGSVVMVAKSVWTWAKAGWQKVAGWSCKAAATVSTFTGPVGSKVASVTCKAKALFQRAWSRTLKLLSLATRWRKTVLAAPAAGVTLGVGCYFSGPMLASFVSGVTGFVSTLAASAWRAVVGLLSGDEAQAT